MHVMEDEYFPGFLSSDFHCKHQIDLLTTTSVHLADILYNDVAMFYFSEVTIYVSMYIVQKIKFGPSGMNRLNREYLYTQHFKN